MTELTLDTNILFYAFDPADTRKHAVARAILEVCCARPTAIPLQCLSEFYRAATKKKLLSPAAATAIVNDLEKELTSIPQNVSDLNLAMHIHQHHNFQFFDCLVIATAFRAGCTVLLSEDFSHNEIISGVTIVNPFQLTQDELSELLQ